jgi:hypothetical protein
MTDNAEHAKTLRRKVETLLDGTMSPEIARRSERVIWGFLNGFYKHEGMLSHEGIESQMRNCGFMRREKKYAK